MTQAARLRPEEREFFQGLAKVIFSNPFTPRTAALESLAGRRRRPPAGSHAFVALVPALTERLRALEARGVAQLGAVDPADRDRLGHGYLFLIYDRFVDDFDALIREQLARGDDPVRVPFASKLLDALTSRGFKKRESVRFIALFYQIRRAYFFIARSLVGASPAMKRLRRALWDNVFTSDILAYKDHLWDRMEDFSTLLLGETGTGKGSAAAAIGRSGLIPFDEKTGRFTCSFTGTFISMNLSQFPESLIESELFGHRKGSFTGAIEDHVGLFGRCSPHGALFLDEIGDLPAPIQLKLLNVIQERRFSPVGGRRPMRFEGRVIAATNRPLDDLRREGKFRDDFFYRLSSDVIEVPSLCERIRQYPKELDQLVHLLLARITGRPDDELAAAVLKHLRAGLPANYPWPGNVRELEQALRRILLKGSYQVEPGHGEPDDSWVGRLREGGLTASELLHQYCRMLYERHGSYEEVARRTSLDRRTVKKHVSPSPLQGR